jgi:hypothetical protein
MTAKTQRHEEVILDHESGTVSSAREVGTDRRSGIRGNDFDRITG